MHVLELCLCSNDILGGILILNGPPVDALSPTITAISTCGVFPSRLLASALQGACMYTQKHSAAPLLKSPKWACQRAGITIHWETKAGLISNLKHNSSIRVTFPPRRHANAFVLFVLTAAAAASNKQTHVTVEHLMPSALPRQQRECQGWADLEAVSHLQY